MWRTVTLVSVLAVAGCIARPPSVYNYNTANLGNEQMGTPGKSVRGGYSWTAPNGRKFSVNYIADNKGYRIVDSSYGRELPMSAHYNPVVKPTVSFPPKIPSAPKATLKPWAPKPKTPTSFSNHHQSFTKPKTPSFLTQPSLPKLKTPTYPTSVFVKQTTKQSAPTFPPQPSFAAPKFPPPPSFTAPKRVPDLPKPQVFSKTPFNSVGQSSLGGSHFSPVTHNKVRSKTTTTRRPVTVIFFTTPKPTVGATQETATVPAATTTNSAKAASSTSGSDKTSSTQSASTTSKGMESSVTAGSQSSKVASAKSADGIASMSGMEGASASEAGTGKETEAAAPESETEGAGAEGEEGAETEAGEEEGEGEAEGEGEGEEAEGEGGEAEEEEYEEYEGYEEENESDSNSEGDEW